MLGTISAFGARGGDLIEFVKGMAAKETPCSNVLFHQLRFANSGAFPVSISFDTTFKPALRFIQFFDNPATLSH